MNVFKELGMTYLEKVKDNQELVNERLAKTKPHMITALKMAMEGFELYTRGLLEAIQEYQELKEELRNENTLWYLNSDLSDLRARKDELLEEYKDIRYQVEVLCEKALIFSGLKEIA